MGHLNYNWIISLGGTMTIQAVLQVLNEAVKRGDCYKKAMDSILFGKYRSWNVVHGIPTLLGGPYQGQKYGHAWLEKGNTVYDPTMDIEVDKRVYYAMGQIKYTVTYTPMEARAKAVETMHYGPWDQKVWNADPEGGTPFKE